VPGARGGGTHWEVSTRKTTVLSRLGMNGVVQSAIIEAM
jgi:hypothetical protein